MRILLDARYLKNDFTGIGNYSRDLIEAIGRLDHSNDYTIMVHESFKGELDLPDNFEIAEEPALPLSLATVLTMGANYRKHNPDMVHSLMPLRPMNWKGKHLGTVFDLQAVIDPQFTGRRRAPVRAVYDFFYRYYYRRSFTDSDYLMCVSYSTKNDMIAMYPHMADKLLVVHAGIGEDARQLPSVETIKRVRERFNLPDRFILYLGSTRPNKNLPRMVEAFADFIKTNPQQDDLHFVMILNPDRFFDPLFSSIRERDLLRRIHIHEQVKESEKRVFYREAELLYFVTKFEGFGLPVLEAQAMGCAVLCSTHGSLPEVAGKAAILADADDTASIVNALKQFYDTPGKKEELVGLGYENLDRFNWDRVAREVVDMYEHVIS